MFKNPQSDLGWLQSAPPIYRYKTLADILVLTFWRCDKQKSKEETGETAFKYIMSVSVPTGTLQATIWSEQSRAECKEANKKTAHKKVGEIYVLCIWKKNINSYIIVLNHQISVMVSVLVLVLKPLYRSGISSCFLLLRETSVFVSHERRHRQNTWYYFYFVISNNRANIICLHLGLIRYIS